MKPLIRRREIDKRYCWAWLASALALAPTTGANADEAVTGGPPGANCWGAVPTIVCGGGLCVGTAGADVILGSNLADQIYALHGNDIVCGGGGNDLIYGSFGNDSLFGQDGNDTIFGDSGEDLLNGNNGADILNGGASADRIFGGDGNDSAHGGDGNDRIGGGNQNDNITGGNGADVLFGEAGSDTVHGDGNNDEIEGGTGNDILQGGSGDDRIFGQAGLDALHGGDGADALAGGDHDDEIHGGAGDDQLDGDAGNDELYGEADDDQLFGDVGADDLCDGGAGTDEHYSGATCETLVSLELPAADGDDGLGIGALCDFWEQDCADDLKCSSTPGEPFQCQPLPDNPDQVGDECAASEEGDSCDAGSLCIQGLCIALCGGSAASPTCPLPDETCHIYDDGPALCETMCDPLVASACPGGWKCTTEPGNLEMFTCSAVDQSEDGGPPLLPGDLCTQMNQCQQGFVCQQYDTLLDYCDEQEGSCCSPMCDVSEAGVCPAPLSCYPFYPEGSAPPGLEHVGVCVAFL